jgi:DNA repair ATPase RecN
VLKVAKNEFGHCADNLKIAKRKEVQLEDHKTQLKSYMDANASTEKELEVINEKKDAMEKVEREYGKISNEVTAKRVMINERKHLIADLRGKISEPFEGDLDELIQLIESFDHQQKQKAEVMSGVSRDPLVKV